MWVLKTRLKLGNVVDGQILSSQTNATLEVKAEKHRQTSQDACCAVHALPRSLEHVVSTLPGAGAAQTVKLPCQSVLVAVDASEPTVAGPKQGCRDRVLCLSRSPIYYTSQNAEQTRTPTHNGHYTKSGGVG